MGGSIFFSFLAGSVFFSPEVMRFTPPPYNGLVAQAMLERFFLLHYICGGIAIVHLFADWLEKPGTFPKKGLAQNSPSGISKSMNFRSRAKVHRP